MVECLIPLQALVLELRARLAAGDGAEASRRMVEEGVTRREMHPPRTVGGAWNRIEQRERERREREREMAGVVK